MKFRIVEQRGVFRIRKKVFIVWTSLGDWDHYSGVAGRTIPHEFDTYKKAEKYIKEFYGSTGVDAIEKPAWTVK